MDLEKILTLASTSGLNKEQFFQLFNEEWRKERERRSAQREELDRELKRRCEERERRKNGERAGHEPEGTRVTDLYEAREKERTPIADSEEARAVQRPLVAHRYDGNEKIKGRAFSERSAEEKGALEARGGELAVGGRIADEAVGDRSRNTPGEDSLLTRSTSDDSVDLKVSESVIIETETKAAPCNDTNSIRTETSIAGRIAMPMTVESALVPQKEIANYLDGSADTAASMMVNGVAIAQPSPRSSEQLALLPQTELLVDLEPCLEKFRLGTGQGLVPDKRQLQAPGKGAEKQGDEKMGARFRKRAKQRRKNSWGLRKIRGHKRSCAKRETIVAEIAELAHATKMTRRQPAKACKMNCWLRSQYAGRGGVDQKICSKFSSRSSRSANASGERKCRCAKKRKKKRPCESLEIKRNWRQGTGHRPVRRVNVEGGSNRDESVVKGAEWTRRKKVKMKTELNKAG